MSTRVFLVSVLTVASLALSGCGAVQNSALANSNTTQQSSATGSTNSSASNPPSTSGSTTSSASSPTPPSTPPPSTPSAGSSGTGNSDPTPTPPPTPPSSPAPVSNDGPVIPANAQVFTNIDEMTGWQQCDVCAGANGSGPTTPHTMAQLLATPSLDSKSAQFTITPTTAYGNALWWKQLGAKPNATHFVYDLWFYIQNPSVSQALEFDANQSVGGHKYIFGTQCNLRGSKQWEIWSSSQHWAATGVSCAAITGMAWHHLIWEFERTSNSQVHFVALTLDGKRSYLDTLANPIASSAKELNVAFQMDADSKQDSYSVWLDKVQLTYW